MGRFRLPWWRPQIGTQQMARYPRQALDLGHPLGGHPRPHRDRGLRDAEAAREQGDAPTLRPDEVHAVHKHNITPPDNGRSITKRAQASFINRAADVSADNYDMDLPMRIRTGRKRARLTQEQLANLLRCKQSAISQWESGRSAPDLDNRIRLADALKIPLPELLPEAGDVPANLLSDPIVLRLVEQYSQLPPQWQATISLLVAHVLETLRQQR
jgi:transcriptional regulator with XRE-family HTH domain